MPTASATPFTTPSHTWTQAEDTLLRQLWGQGLHHETIAARMGRSPKSITGRAHRIGLGSRVVREGRDVMIGQTTPRACLSCGLIFASTWSGNRICTPCTHEHSSMGQYAGSITISAGF